MFECEKCRDTDYVTCTHQGTGRDADGWCTECESPVGEPVEILCDCQW